jgi:hypothetical protein
MKRYNGATAWPAQQAAPAYQGDIESQTPAREASLAADLLVPLGQAMVSGALGSGLIVLALGSVAPSLEVDGFRLWALSALVISTATWWILLCQTRSLLWAKEKRTGIDLDGDGIVGPPVALPPIQVEVTSGQKQVYLDLPGKPEALAMLARGVLAGRPMAEDSWSGRAGPFSRSEFRAIRDTLIERGLATWRNPDAKAQGCELTHAGRAMFRRLAELAK